MILTHEHEMIRDSLRAFAQERLAPFAAEWDRYHTCLLYTSRCV